MKWEGNLCFCESINIIWFWICTIAYFKSKVCFLREINYNWCRFTLIIFHSSNLRTNHLDRFELSKLIHWKGLIQENDSFTNPTSLRTAIKASGKTDNSLKKILWGGGRNTDNYNSDNKITNNFRPVNQK